MFILSDWTPRSLLGIRSSSSMVSVFGANSVLNSVESGQGVDGGEMSDAKQYSGVLLLINVPKGTKSGVETMLVNVSCISDFDSQEKPNSTNELAYQRNQYHWM